MSTIYQSPRKSAHTMAVHLNALAKNPTNNWISSPLKSRRCAISVKNMLAPAVKGILLPPPNQNKQSKRVLLHRDYSHTLFWVWDEIKLKLELNPEQTAKSLLDGFIVKYPADFKAGHLRTLQRRVLHWRRSQLDQEARLRTIMRPHEVNIL